MAVGEHVQMRAASGSNSFHDLIAVGDLGEDEETWIVDTFSPKVMIFTGLSPAHSSKVDLDHILMAGQSRQLLNTLQPYHVFQPAANVSLIDDSPNFVRKLCLDIPLSKPCIAVGFQDPQRPTSLRHFAEPCRSIPKAKCFSGHETHAASTTHPGSIQYRPV